MDWENGVNGHSVNPPVLQVERDCVTDHLPRGRCNPVGVTYLKHSFAFFQVSKCEIRKKKEEEIPPSL